MSQITNVLHFTENKETLRKMKNRAIDKHFKKLQFQLKHAPLTLKVLSYIIPEERKALSALSDFLSSPVGKKFSGMLSKSYDAVAAFEKGEYDTAKEEGKSLIRAYTVNDFGEVVNSLTDFAIENIDSLKGALVI